MALTIIAPAPNAILELGTDILIRWTKPSVSDPSGIEYKLELAEDGINYRLCESAMEPAATITWNARGIASNIAQLRVSAWKGTQRVEQHAIPVTLQASLPVTIVTRLGTLEGELANVKSGVTKVGAAGRSDEARSLRASAGGSSLQISGTTPVLDLIGTDHARIQLYPQGSGAGQKGWLGYGGVGSTTMTIHNDVGQLVLGGSSIAAPSGIIIQGAVPHIEADGSFYRNTDGQVYITVDDLLRLRDTSAASWAVEFNTNQGSLALKGALSAGGDVTLCGKHALRASDAWLRLNQDGHFGAGVYTPGILRVDGDVQLGGKHAFRASDAWLRLNQDGHFGAGVYTPGILRVDGDVQLGGKHAFRSSDAWLRLNQDGHFAAGVYTPGILRVDGDVQLGGKHAFRSSDAWLRLNQDGHFAAGVHTPHNLTSGALNVGGVNDWGNPGSGNVWVSGEIRSNGDVVAQSFRGPSQVVVFTPGNLHHTHPSLGGTQLAIGWNSSGGRGETCFYQHGDGGWRSGYDFYTQSDSKDVTLQARIEDTGNLNVRGRFGSLSDARDKTNIRTITDALKKVLELRGVAFDWADDRARDGDSHLGLVAQEVLPVVPEVVHGGEVGPRGDQERYQLHYDGLVPLLIEAIKEQQATIDALEARVARLEAR